MKDMDIFQHMGLFIVTSILTFWFMPEDLRIYVQKHRYLGFGELVVIFNIGINMLIPWK